MTGDVFLSLFNPCFLVQGPTYIFPIEVFNIKKTSCPQSQDSFFPFGNCGKTAFEFLRYAPLACVLGEGIVIVAH